MKMKNEYRCTCSKTRWLCREKQSLACRHIAKSKKPKKHFVSYMSCQNVLPTPSARAPEPLTSLRVGAEVTDRGAEEVTDRGVAGLAGLGGWDLFTLLDDEGRERRPLPSPTASAGAWGVAALVNRDPWLTIGLSMILISWFLSAALVNKEPWLTIGLSMIFISWFLSLDFRPCSCGAEKGADWGVETTCIKSTCF